MFTRTTAINKILSLQKRIKVIPGGTSAGKTLGVSAVLINTAATFPGKRISVVSESLPHLKMGAMRDFKEIMIQTGRWIEYNWHITDSRYTFANGSFIEFFGADNRGKVTGPRRDILYINEINNIAFEIYDALAIRTFEDIYLDFNPTNEFWAHAELKADEDIEWLTLTYLDNEGLPESILKELLKRKEKAITSTYWANWWKVYGEGQLGILEGVIFDDFQIIDKIPDDARLVSYGLDFGFTHDPAALVRVFKKEESLYVKELMYSTRLTNQDICKQLRNMGINDKIVADSAEPKSIQEIYNEGFNIHPSKKGEDSIRNSIDILKRYKIFITSDSTNLIREIRRYCWDKDKEGKETGKPIDADNHLIDALRYVALNELASSTQGKYVYARLNKG